MLTYESKTTGSTKDHDDFGVGFQITIYCRVHSRINIPVHALSEHEGCGVIINGGHCDGKW